MEFWRSDGTADGTRLLREFVPGPLEGYPLELTPIGNEVFFTAWTPNLGRELWRSDGTTTGTRLVADIRRGPESSYPTNLSAVGGQLYYFADDGIHGREPFRLDPGTPSRPVADFDGDGLGDLAVYRPDLSQFLVRNSSGAAQSISFGPGSLYTKATVPPTAIAGDLDADGRADLVVYRPDTSQFFVRYADGRTGPFTFGPGSLYTGAADAPTPTLGDLDGDGLGDLAVYRPDLSTFYVRYADGRTQALAFGPGSLYTGASVPPVGLAGDLDGDGRADLAVYRPDLSEFYVRYATGATAAFGFGPGSLYTKATVPPRPVLGDFDGDGRADLAVYRPDTSQFFVRYASGQTGPFTFGPGSLLHRGVRAPGPVGQRPGRRWEGRPGRLPPRYLAILREVCDRRHPGDQLRPREPRHRGDPAAGAGSLGADLATRAVVRRGIPGDLPDGGRVGPGSALEASRVELPAAGVIADAWLQAVCFRRCPSTRPTPQADLVGQVSTGGPRLEAPGDLDGDPIAPAGGGCPTIDGAGLATFRAGTATTTRHDRRRGRPMSTAVPPRRRATGPDSIRPLEPGDRLGSVEFERRYRAMPPGTRAELVEGIVYMPSPVRFKHHGEPHGSIMTWLGTYRAATPGVRMADNATVRLDLDNQPQPDAFLMIDPARGGQARIGADDYVEGAPELVVEVAASSEGYDLHAKLQAYRRNGVREYLVWRVLDEAVDRFAAAEGRFDRLAPDPDGLLRSLVFPGLWLDPEALIRGDLAAVLEVVRRGTASPEHAEFAARLRG